MHQIILALIALILSSCATPQQFNQKFPDDLSTLDDEKKQKLYGAFVMEDWAGTSGTHFFIGGDDDEHRFTMESLRPVINQVSDTPLDDDMNEIDDYHQAGIYSLYSASGLFAAAAIGYAAQQEDLYHTSQSLGLVSLFLWVMLEQYEWQMKDQVQYQYNEALREKLKISWESDNVSKGPPTLDSGSLAVWKLEF